MINKSSLVLSSSSANGMSSFHLSKQASNAKKDEDSTKTGQTDKPSPRYIKYKEEVSKHPEKIRDLSFLKQAIRQGRISEITLRETIPSNQFKSEIELVFQTRDGRKGGFTIGAASSESIESLREIAEENNTLFFQSNPSITDNALAILITGAGLLAAPVLAYGCFEWGNYKKSTRMYEQIRRDIRRPGELLPPDITLDNFDEKLPGSDLESSYRQRINNMKDTVRKYATWKKGGGPRLTTDDLRDLSYLIAGNAGTGKSDAVRSYIRSFLKELHEYELQDDAILINLKKLQMAAKGEIQEDSSDPIAEVIENLQASMIGGVSILEVIKTVAKESDAAFVIVDVDDAKWADFLGNGTKRAPYKNIFNDIADRGREINESASLLTEDPWFTRVINGFRKNILRQEIGDGRNLLNIFLVGCSNDRVYLSEEYQKDNAATLQRLGNIIPSGVKIPVKDRIKSLMKRSLRERFELTPEEMTTHQDKLLSIATSYANLVYTDEPFPSITFRVDQDILKNLRQEMDSRDGDLSVKLERLDIALRVMKQIQKGASENESSLEDKFKREINNSELLSSEDDQQQLNKEIKKINQLANIVSDKIARAIPDQSIGEGNTTATMQQPIGESE